MEVVETSKKVLGEKHPSTLTSMANLASTYQSQGRWKEAEEMNWRVLEGYEKVLGIEHPNTLTSVDSLALIMQHQGKYEAAEEMNRRALKGYEKMLGSEASKFLCAIVTHHDVVFRLVHYHSGLAAGLQFLGSCKDATQCHTLQRRASARPRHSPCSMVLQQAIGGLM